jgi:hypothetical protein
MKISSLILSFIILFQSLSFEIMDINKFSNFISDMNCHIQEGESFAEFISDHYKDNSDPHEHKGILHEHDDHGELPFKHQHLDNHIQLVFVFFPNDFQTNFEERIASNKNFNYREPLSNLFSDSLFQPPRV